MNAMFEPFAHFLAYGSTDQQSLRTLTSQYTGMIVPGTTAAFQAEGTRGFVLTLSAAEKFPYAIDPRFPLFQERIPKVRKSHLLLADVFGIGDIISRHGQMRPDDWTSEVEDTIVERWIAFNSNYTNLRPAAFEKYARRLKRELPQDEAAPPTWILPPYLMESDHYVDAWEISNRLWSKSVAAAREGGHESRLRRVVATWDPANLSALVGTVDQDEIVVWVSDLDELDLLRGQRLSTYARAIREIADSGKKPFALYGGYFAVALGSVGLVGASHGVGFSEYRNHVELPTTGGAPARYYVQRIHRYLPVDLASELWRRDARLVESYYPGFRSSDPLELEYHELMAHSVRARNDEIVKASELTALDHVDELDAVAGEYAEDLKQIRLTEGLRKRIEQFVAHLPVWRFALRESLD